MNKFRLLIILFFMFSISFMSQALNRYAIIVGVNDYEILTDLQAGVNDAEKMASYYDGLGFKVWLMSDRQESKFDKPSLANIERVLSNINMLSQDQNIDELVIFFAGHGLQIKGENYLCFPETDITTDSGMLNVDQTLMPWIRDIKANLSMVYLDACRNDIGSMRAAGIVRGIEVVGVEKDEINTGNIAIFYAAKPGSFSYEKADGSNGFFTDTLIEALQSPVTNNISDLYTYIRTVLPERTESIFGRPQIPHLGGDFDLTVSFSKGNVDLTAFDTSGKIFVESSIEGATIKINGIIRGETPKLIENINPGNVFIEVESDDLYGSKQISLLAKEFQSIEIKLKEATGDVVISNLTTIDGNNGKTNISDITSLLKDTDIFIDGEKIESQSSSLIKFIKPGSRNIVIKGNGFYGESQISIEKNSVQNISFELNFVGDLYILNPKDSVIKMNRKLDGFEIISEKTDKSNLELTDIPVGSWEVSVVREGYKTYIKEVEILQGEQVIITPKFIKDFDSAGIDFFNFYTPIEFLGGNIVSAGAGVSIFNKRLDLKILYGFTLYDETLYDSTEIETYGWSLGGELTHHLIFPNKPLNFYYGAFYRYNYFENTEDTNIQDKSWLGITTGLEYHLEGFTFYTDINSVFPHITWYWPEITIRLGVKLWF
ncbi:MAG: caspase family protein [Spirochaetaceae bacterium]